jgi:phage terminase small subunit
MTSTARKLEPIDAKCGPAMAALNDRQQRYVHALFEAPRSHGSGVFAAKVAGYSASSRGVLASIAYQLNGDPRVQAAIAEVSQQHLTTLGPLAVRALKRVLDNPAHRDFGRAIGIVMDRVAPQNSTHIVKLEGEVKLTSSETAQVMSRIEELAAKFAVQLPAPKIIEGELA